MSFFDRLMLWFHVAFVMFTIGPVTFAVLESPRVIRRRNIPVLRYLSRMTILFGSATLGVLAFGMILGQSLGELAEVWLTVAVTLFVVAFVLLLLIMRDQRRAINALEGAAEEEELAAADAAEAAAAAAGNGGTGEDGEDGEDGVVDGDRGTEGNAGMPGHATTRPGTDAAAASPSQIANVERGRIATMGGIVSVLWLAILVLMIWQP